MRIVIPEAEWDESPYKTPEWENSVQIKMWEHNYENKEYIIVYEPLKTQTK